MGGLTPAFTSLLPRSVVYRDLAAGGLRGELYPVNPKHRTVYGRRAYPRLSRLSGPVDLAVIATPSRTVPEIIEDAGAAGVKAAIVLGSGALHQKMLEAAKRHGVRILGPNCLGAMRTDVGLNATFARTPALPLLARFTQLDYDRERALVALWQGEIIAVGRYAPNQDGKTAEFALTVADEWQGKGIGRALLEKLCKAARQAGYEALYGYILADNHEMLELAQRLGFTEVARDGGEVTVARRLK